jgi:hypothetical protein
LLVEICSTFFGNFEVMYVLSTKKDDFVEGKVNDGNKDVIENLVWKINQQKFLAFMKGQWHLLPETFMKLKNSGVHKLET